MYLKIILKNETSAKLYIDLCKFKGTNKMTAHGYYYIHVEGQKLIWKCTFKIYFGHSLWERGEKNEP